MLQDRCPASPVCLSVTLVYCGQMVGWIKMPLGTEVDLGLGSIMSDGDPASHGKGHSTAGLHFSAHFALARSTISATAEYLSVEAISLILLQISSPLNLRAPPPHEK